jgi:hypothetical protein
MEQHCLPGSYRTWFCKTVKTSGLVSNCLRIFFSLMGRRNLSVRVSICSFLVSGRRNAGISCYWLARPPDRLYRRRNVARPKGFASQNSAFRVRRIPHVLGVYFYVSRRGVEKKRNLSHKLKFIFPSYINFTSVQVQCLLFVYHQTSL